MGFVHELYKRAQYSPSIASLDVSPHGSEKSISRLAFFRRRIHLNGTSNFSIPLGIVLLFPSIVIILILVLFVRHPSSPGRILMPAGAPPTIRYRHFWLYSSLL
jgi:mannosyltransferase